MMKNRNGDPERTRIGSGLQRLDVVHPAQGTHGILRRPVVSMSNLSAHFSRRFNSCSTASRTKSVRSSPGFSDAAMRANVPSAKRACMSSAQRLILPTRRGVSHTRFCAKAVLFLISVIAPINHMSYISHIRYGGKA